jgi:hypothetical protein
MYRKKATSRKRKAVYPSEFDQQCLVFQWAMWNLKKYPHLKLLHSSLNGVKLSIGQAVKAKKSGMTKGIPDINLPFACLEYTQLYIEMKIGKNKLTSEQKELRDLLVMGGAFYSVAYSAKEAIDTIEKYVAQCKPLKVIDGIT